jgi:hypothetical protein
MTLWVLEAPGTNQDEVCESCPMHGITDAVVGCSRCMCPSDSNKTGAYLQFDTGRSRRRCKGKNMSYVVPMTDEI